MITNHSRNIAVNASCISLNWPIKGYNISDLDEIYNAAEALALYEERPGFYWGEKCNWEEICAQIALRLSNRTECDWEKEVEMLIRNHGL